VAQDLRFRDYGAERRAIVREFYQLNHRHQCVEFVRAKRREFATLDRRRMGAWEALLYLDTLVDDSDPDTELSQLAHLLQTAEAIRAAGHPEWLQLTGLLHDLGKILCLWGEPQWAVVGDTFPVGCRFDSAVVFHELFAGNPDLDHPIYRTELGLYEPGCGLDDVLMSWGHDEYLYRVLRDHLPPEALAILRYHSFYAAHSGRAYGHLMNARDQVLFEWVRAFQPFDLYSKADDPPNVTALAPYYRELIDRHLPAELAW
jgi:inositol oxygenase